jgi:serine/threonine protein kinase
MSELAIFTEEQLVQIFPDYSLTLIRTSRLEALYKGIDKDGNQSLVKILHPHLAENKDATLQFKNELLAMQNLSHAGFLGLAGYGEIGNVPYAFTECFEGTPLHEAFPNCRLTEQNVASIGSQICNAIDHLHAKGMVHLSIKISNIWINPEGEVKLVQLGQVRFANIEVEYPELMGTEGYTAPELMNGQAEALPLCDIYSCGAVLYALLTAERPPATMMPPSKICGCSTLMDEVVAAACHSNPGLRIESPAILGRVLSELASLSASSSLSFHELMARALSLSEPLIDPVIEAGVPVEPAQAAEAAEAINRVEEMKATKRVEKNEEILGAEQVDVHQSPERDVLRPVKKNTFRYVAIASSLLLLAALSWYFFISSDSSPSEVAVVDPFDSSQAALLEAAAQDELAAVDTRPDIKPGYIENPWFSKKDKEIENKRVRSKIIEINHKGVMFYLYMPEGKPVGVLADIPWQIDLQLVEQHITSFHYVRKAIACNYAVLGWRSPARKWTEGRDYGIDQHNLTAAQRKDREARWKEWLPKIHKGIDAICKKYKLPANGFLGRTDCLSAVRLSRYIEQYPERFSAVVHDKPHSLFTPRDKHRHLFSVLIAPMDSYYYPSGRDFFLKANQLGHPALLQVLNRRTNIKANRVVDLLFDYLYQKRENLGFEKTLSPQEIIQFADSISYDLAEAPYIQDPINEGIHSRADADWLPTEQQVRIPHYSMLSLWESGSRAKRNNYVETFDTLKKGKHKKLQTSFATLSSVGDSEFSLDQSSHAPHSGYVINFQGGGEQEYDINIKPVDVATELRFQYHNLAKGGYFEVLVYDGEEWKQSIRLENHPKVSPQALQTIVRIPIAAKLSKLKIRCKNQSGSHLIDNMMLVGM